MYKVIRYQFLFVLLCVGMSLIFSCDENPRALDDQSIAHQFKVSQDSLELRTLEGSYYYEGKPFTGVAISNYAAGSIASRITYVNGKKHGRYERWFENGIRSFESNYVDGKKHGKTYSWWRNGNRRSENNFKVGVPDGEQLEWYKSGAKFKKLVLVNGHEEGLQRSWRENGKLYNNYEAKNGRIFGLKRAALCFQLEDEEVKYKND